MSLDSPITRRNLIETSIGAAVIPCSALLLAAWRKAPDQPLVFSPLDFEALQSFTEILIPSDETPGAREARCAHFIDFLLQSSADLPKVQASWRSAMQYLKDAGFHQASSGRRLELVTEMSNQNTFAFHLIKQQTVFAFYTSREGLIQTLDYKGNSFNLSFPACTHPEHQVV